MPILPAAQQGTGTGLWNPYIVDHTLVECRERGHRLALQNRNGSSSGCFLSYEQGGLSLHNNCNNKRKRKPKAKSFTGKKYRGLKIKKKKRL